jgi:hypothetical protein
MLTKIYSAQDSSLSGCLNKLKNDFSNDLGEADFLFFAVNPDFNVNLIGGLGNADLLARCRELALGRRHVGTPPQQLRRKSGRYLRNIVGLGIGTHGKSRRIPARQYRQRVLRQRSATAQIVEVGPRAGQIATCPDGIEVRRHADVCAVFGEPQLILAQTLRVFEHGGLPVVCTQQQEGGRGVGREAQAQSIDGVAASL